MNVTTIPPESSGTEVGHGRLASVVRHHLVECIDTSYPDLMLESMSVEVVPQRLFFSNSNHLKCLVRGQTAEGQWAQRCIHVKRSRSADIEYANLAHLWGSHFHRDNINRIPRPLACCAQWNLLLTECISDQTALLPWLIKYTLPLGVLLDGQAAMMRMQRIADWLVAFQSGKSSARVEPPPVHVDDIGEALDDLIATPYLRPEARHSITRRLSSARSAMTREPMVLSHGDFTARNILLSQDSVTVVDWEKPLSKRHPLYDVQTFLVNLERRLSYPCCSQQRVDELRQAFMTRYLAQVRFEINEQLLAISRAVVLIHQLKAEHRALQRGLIDVILTRRKPFIRYLLAEIERG